MTRIFILNCICALLTSCAASRSKPEIGTPAEASRVTDVSVELSPILPGWMRISEMRPGEEYVLEDLNALYGYARKTFGDKVLIESFIEINVYSVESATPRFLCHRAGEEAAIKDWEHGAVHIGNGGRECTMSLRHYGTADYRGRIRAFYVSDEYIVEMAGTWPMDSHRPRSRDFFELSESVVIVRE